MNDSILSIRLTLELMKKNRGVHYFDGFFLKNMFYKSTIAPCLQYKFKFSSLKLSNQIEGVRIKTRLGHIFTKNDLLVCLIRKPD